MGMAFGFGWTPCIGPVLAAILTQAATQETVMRGMFLLFLFSMGMGIPFILAGIGVTKLLLGNQAAPAAPPQDQRGVGAPDDGVRMAVHHRQDHRPVEPHQRMDDPPGSGMAGRDLMVGSLIM